MTVSKQIARHAAAVLELHAEAEHLGDFASRCELMAWEPSLTDRERAYLDRRAAKYRELQFAALTKLSRMQGE